MAAIPALLRMLLICVWQCTSGLQGQVAAAKAVKAGTGSFERHRKMGPVSAAAPVIQW